MDSNKSQRPNGAANAVAGALAAPNEKTNGKAFACTANGSSRPSSAGFVPVKRPAIGGIKVTTVKRAPPPPPVQQKQLLNASSSSSSSTNGRERTPLNALPEETRRRIEGARRERERKLAQEAAAARSASSSGKPRQGSGEAASRQGTPKKKHKIARDIVSDSSDDGDGDDLFSTSGRSSPATKRKSVSREQSLSAMTGLTGYKKLGRVGVQSRYLVPRSVIAEDAFSMDGGNVAARNVIQSSDLVSRGKAYGPFFHGLEGEQRTRLEYPADGASEEFILLVPKDRDEYDPISDLLRAVRCMVEYYLGQDEQGLFGSLDSLETSSAAGNVLRDTNCGPSANFERNSLTPGTTSQSASREATPAASLASGDDTNTSKSSQAPPSSPARSAILANASAAAAASLPLSSHEDKGGDSDRDTILRSFTKARNRRDGPLFVRTVERFNGTLRTLKEAGKVRDNVRAMSKTGIPEGIWRCLQEQCYARTVGPRVEELSKYEAFSDNVYGELLPRFMSEIAHLTSLGPDSVFVDLGSGVGNLLIQVALQTGSQAYGCEQMAAPSALARAQVNEAQHRWKMWGLRGAPTEAWEGDFGESTEVRDVLRRADVILVNNYAFTARTNDKLSLLFLDLKDGAHIVSLKPFVPADFRLTERTLSSPLAILKVAQRTYTSGCVSWADGGGKYYIHTVDRSNIAHFLAEKEGRGDAPASHSRRKRQWKAIREGSDDEA